SIPAGNVATYGDVARLAGTPGAARHVGAVLHALPADSGLPWHRVVNAQGRLSLRPGTAAGRLQKTRLEAEGVLFSVNGRISLQRFRWQRLP
ncbi:MAG: MGMT family protein, partial [Halioglobus sp.]|nr:MGMT family protein [Halioglobus sp.]